MFAFVCFLIAYPKADVVQVYLVNSRLERMSNSKLFEYIDPDKEQEDFVRKLSTAWRIFKKCYSYYLKMCAK